MSSMNVIQAYVALLYVVAVLPLTKSDVTCSYVKPCDWQRAVQNLWLFQTSSTEDTKFIRLRWLERWSWPANFPYPVC